MLKLPDLPANIPREVTLDLAEVRGANGEVELTEVLHVMMDKNGNILNMRNLPTVSAQNVNIVELK